MISKPAQTSQPLIEPLAERWSGRAFDPERPVAREHLIALLEAARWAPSCYGDQPWRYMVWDRFADMDTWRRAFECLAEGNQGWARAAPILGLACAKETFERDGKPNRWAQYDTGAASMSIAIQATGLGLMVHQMGGFSQDAVREAFKVPEECTPMAMFAIGYQLPKGRIDPEAAERELAERGRRPLEHLFYEGEWESPVKGP